MPRRRSPHAEAAFAAPTGPTEERPALSQERVIAAAQSLLDDEGLDGLSMRNLAGRLGVKAASLYWYVRDKQELLALLADAICAEVQPPDAGAPWRAQLEVHIWDYRRVLLAHRDAARVISGSMPSGPNRLRLVDLALGALLEAGFGGLAAMRAGRLLADYVEAFVLEEIREMAMLRAAAEPGSAAAAALAEAGRQFLEASSGDYPSIAFVAALVPDTDADGRFRFGGKVILDGLERQLSPEQGQSPRS
jgi:TetR/AcrR family tetracycline transcriptional repressor